MSDSKCPKCGAVIWPEEGDLVFRCRSVRDESGAASLSYQSADCHISALEREREELADALGEVSDILASVIRSMPSERLHEVWTEAINRASGIAFRGWKSVRLKPSERKDGGA